MKSEDQVRTGFPAHDELLPPSFSAHVPTGGHLEEVVKLRTENFRLQRLVAELLVENQQLRQRYCGSPKSPERASSTRHLSERREHRDH